MLTKINTRLLFIISFLIINNSTLKAQTDSKFGFGINLSNNIVNLLTRNYSFNGGFVIEPLFKYKIHDKFDYNLILGYERVSSKNILLETNNSSQILNYENKGYYFKTGVSVNIGSDKALFRNSVGLLIGYSNYIEYSEYFIKGNYFGDLIGDYKTTRQSIVFIEPDFNMVLLNFKSFNLLVNFNLPILVYSKSDDTMPHYFIPGYGGRFDFENMHYFILYRMNLYLTVTI